MLTAEFHYLTESEPRWPVCLVHVLDQALHIRRFGIKVSGVFEKWNRTIESSVLDNSCDDVGPFYEAGMGAAGQCFLGRNPFTNEGVKGRENLCAFGQYPLQVQ